MPNTKNQKKYLETGWAKKNLFSQIAEQSALARQSSTTRSRNCLYETFDGIDKERRSVSRWTPRVSPSVGSPTRGSRRTRRPPANYPPLRAVASSRSTPVTCGITIPSYNRSYPFRLSAFGRGHITPRWIRQSGQQVTAGRSGLVKNQPC